MEYGAYSHKGVLRRSNEDYYYIPGEDGIATDLNMIIVADGMGGHNAGDTASRVTVEYIKSYLEEHCMSLTGSEFLLNCMNQAIQEANQRVYSLSCADLHLSGMGTTLTMAFFLGDKVHIAHIGDSRCYIISDKAVRQITRDHSLVQELLDNGTITKDEMDIHPKKNVITRALGTEGRLRIDCFEEEVGIGDIVLLCTDGLVNYVNIEGYIGNLPSDISVNTLIEILGNEALAAGGTDDITIVAARYTGNGGKR